MTQNGTVQLTKPIGASGLNVMSGYVYEDFLKELRGTRGVAIYKEMSEQDAVISSILFAIEMLIRQVTWRVEPFSDEQGDIDNAKFVDECFDDMDNGWEGTLSEILTEVPYGWAWLETVYKRRTHTNSSFDDGKVGWRQWGLRSQDSLLHWELDEFGNPNAMVQIAPPHYKPVTIPFERSLHFRTSARKNNPEGRSMIRGAYRAWYFKRHIEQIEGIGVERDLAGLPVAWVPPELLSPNAPPEAVQVLNEIKKIVTNIRRDEQEGMVYPLEYDENGNKRYDLTLLTTGGTRQFNTDAIISRYDQRIAMTVLADFILLGHENVGSFALSSSKTNLFSYSLGTILDGIMEVVNNYAIPRLFRLNGLPVDRASKLVHGDIESVNLAELGEYVTSLAGAGVILDEQAQEYLLEQAQIPHAKRTSDMDV